MAGPRTATYLEERAQRSTRSRYGHVVAKLSDVDRDPSDGLPEGRRPRGRPTNLASG